MRINWLSWYKNAVPGEQLSLYSLEYEFFRTEGNLTLDIMIVADLVSWLTRRSHTQTIGNDVVVISPSYKWCCSHIIILQMVLLMAYYPRR